MGLQIQVFKADTSRQIETAFENMEHDRPDALFIGTTPFLNVRNVQLAMLAAFHRLPGIHSDREYAEAGGLMSYGADIADALHQMGVYTGRILKGAKLAELPVVQSSNARISARRREALRTPWQQSARNRHSPRAAQSPL
jgi:putative tryptophan/tyrosine transport system substrate-binding protein